MATNGRRRKLAAVVLAALMAASLAGAGPAWAQTGPNPTDPPGGGNGGGGGGSFQSQSSSQGEVQSRSVVFSSERNFDGFVFPSFYYGFFPFGF